MPVLGMCVHLLCPDGQDDKMEQQLRGGLQKGLNPNAWFLFTAAWANGEHACIGDGELTHTHLARH
jgi:hypothetical protein